MLFKLLKITSFSGFDVKVLKHNIIMHVADGSLFVFGINFVSAYTIIPVFIQRAGGSPIAIGAVPVIWSIGLNLPQLFFTKTHYSEKRIKPFVMRYALLFRVMYLIISVFTFFILKNLTQTEAVLSLLFLYLITAVVGSIPIPGWFHLFSKTTPVNLRGRVLGIRQLIGSILALASGSLTILILSVIRFPSNFAALFLTAFIVTMISYYFLSKILEEDESHEEDKPIVTNKLDAIKSILKTNYYFRNFITADALITMCMTATAFFPVFAIKNFDLPTSYAGTFTIIATTGMIISTIFFGYLADVLGHKVNLIILSIALFLASITAIVANNILAYGAVFFFVGMAVSLLNISRISFVIELCSPKERQFYIATLSSITAPFSVFGIAAGALIGFLSYTIVFLIYVFLTGTAVVWLIKKVKDPRFEKITD